MFPTAMKLEGEGYRREKLDAPADGRRRTATRERTASAPTAKELKDASPANEFANTDRYALAQPLFDIEEIAPVRH